MKRAFVALIALAIVGCANPMHTWVAENRSLAEQGKILWSSYYEQLYGQADQYRGPNKAEYMHRINSMILTAKAYERKEISEDQFKYAQRKMQAEQQADVDHAEASRQKAVSAAALRLGQRKPNEFLSPSYPTTSPVQTNCTQFGNQFNCMSY